MKSHYEKYKGYAISRGMYGNGSYNVYNVLGHLVGNAQSKGTARRIVDSLTA